MACKPRSKFVCLVSFEKRTRDDDSNFPFTKLDCFRQKVEENVGLVVVNTIVAVFDVSLASVTLPP